MSSGCRRIREVLVISSAPFRAMPLDHQPGLLLWGASIIVDECRNAMDLALVVPAG